MTVENLMISAVIIVLVFFMFAAAFKPRKGLYDSPVVLLLFALGILLIVTVEHLGVEFPILNSGPLVWATILILMSIFLLWLGDKNP